MYMTTTIPTRPSIDSARGSGIVHSTEFSACVVESIVLTVPPGVTYPLNMGSVLMYPTYPGLVILMTKPKETIKAFLR